MEGEEKKALNITQINDTKIQERKEKKGVNEDVFDSHAHNFMSSSKSHFYVVVSKSSQVFSGYTCMWCRTVPVSVNRPIFTLYPK